MAQPGRHISQNVNITSDGDYRVSFSYRADSQQPGTMTIAFYAFFGLTSLFTQPLNGSVLVDWNTITQDIIGVTAGLYNLKFHIDGTFDSNPGSKFNVCIDDISVKQIL